MKTGLFGKNDGLRFCQNKLLPENMKFNVLASENGAFYKFVKGNNVPFYIDRLQGGCYIDDYEYDRSLLGGYGDLFLGFQMHEWLSNYRSDLIKIGDLQSERWTEEGILKKITDKFNTPFPFLESMTAREMARAGKPDSKEEFCSNMMNIFKKRLGEYGKLIPCDSYFLAFPFEVRSGVPSFMPEIGAQTPDTRIQLCFARGISRANGIPFGAYYEPWGGKPFSSCCYHKDMKNEWGMRNDGDFPFSVHGKNGGSSRSLQKRLLFYAFLSGAEFISEEWGVCNTFVDWNDFELSEYGKVVLEFLEFTRKFGDVGEKISPVAAVLPEDTDVLEEIHSFGSFCGFPLRLDEGARIEKIKSAVSAIFSSPSEMLGTETKILINSDIPDALDIVCAGDDSSLEKYDFLIDLTCDPLFGVGRKNLVSPEEIPELLRKTLPCYVDGGLHWMVNKRLTGGYYLTVFNNSGVSRTVDEGEKFLPEASKTVRLTFKNDSVPEQLIGNGDLSRLDDGSFALSVGAGDISFIRF